MSLLRVVKQNDGSKLKTKWRRARVVRNDVSIDGGYSNALHPAATVQLMDHGERSTFVYLDKNAKWFLHGVGGAKAAKGSLKCVKVMEYLRVWFNSKRNTAVAEETAADAENAAAVAEDSAPVEEEVDPMDAMDEIDDIAGDDMRGAHNKMKMKKNTAPSGYKKVDRARAQIKAIEVPTRPPGYPDSTNIIVRVYRKHDPAVRGQGHGGSLYLSEDCLDWLLSYAHDEWESMGIEAPPMDDDRVGNVATVADLHLAWQFDEDSWRAEFIAGPFQGTSRTLKVADLDKHMWAKLRELDLVSGWLSLNRYREDRKLAARAFLEQWGLAVTRNEPELFVALLEKTNTTPKKMGKKRARDTDSEDPPEAREEETDCEDAPEGTDDQLMEDLMTEF